jgi:hypothetical protein
VKTTAIQLFLVSLCLVAAGPKAHAVSPPPDGGYPGNNTAEGDAALLNLTSGVWNTALGRQALNHDTTGGVNTATGFQALFNNTSGAQNTAYGAQALFGNGIGSLNTAIGYRAMYGANSGNSVAIGAYALYNNFGAFNTAIGYSALFSNGNGNGNTAIGYQALHSNGEEGANTAIGYQALFKNTGTPGSGFSNTATGYQTLFSNTTGDSNTANGEWALHDNTTGGSNVANGFGALQSNTTGFGNIAVGTQAGENLTTGIDNVALGYNAGSNLTTGDYNIDIGNYGNAGDDRTIRIGDQGTQTAAYIAGISGVAVAGDPVVVNSNGQLGVGMPSSKRFKDEIKPMADASEAILALKPVSFCYKSDLDPKRITRFGLVAEEVEKINPDLVARDAKGELYTVRYEAVNAMLLNEFLKEHRTVRELKSTVAKQEAASAKQEAIIATQQKQIEALTMGLQEVSDQLRLSRPAPRTVADNR